MADFTKYTNYTENTSFSGVIMGANAPVLEVELNEIQEIQNTKFKRIMQSLGDGVFITSDGSVTLDNTTVTVTNCALVSEGFLAFIDEASVEVSAVNDHVYFTLQESIATGSDTLYEYGNTEGDTISNPIEDSRVGAETSRRKLVTITLSVGDSFPSSTSSVGNIPVCIFEDNDLTIKAYSDSIIGMIDQIRETSEVMPNPAGEPTEELTALKIGNVIYSLASTAEDVSYDNTESELDSTDVQGAIDEVVSGLDTLAENVDTISDAVQNNSDNFAEEYDTSATYTEGQHCIYNNELYRCTTTISTAESWTLAHWTRVTVCDEYSRMVTLTRAEYDLLSSEAKNNGVLYVISDEDPDAGEIPYDNTDSGLEAEDIQDAIDETVDIMKTPTDTNAMYHLGFYLDENGGLCQVNSI